MKLGGNDRGLLQSTNSVVVPSYERYQETLQWHKPVYSLGSNWVPLEDKSELLPFQET